VIVPDLRRDTEAIELAAEGVARGGDCEDDVAVRQLVGQFGERLSTCVVDVIGTRFYKPVFAETRPDATACSSAS
jgi:hypothetical protein